MCMSIYTFMHQLGTWWSWRKEENVKASEIGVKSSCSHHVGVKNCTWTMQHSQYSLPLSHLSNSLGFHAWIRWNTPISPSNSLVPPRQSLANFMPILYHPLSTVSTHIFSSVYAVVCGHPLEWWFSTFLMLSPFNIIPRVVVTHNLKLIFIATS